MKPFIVLALCCSFFSSRATPLPFEFLDCDDPDVFKAVDTALKKYNGDRATGNQFALYMVMEAKRTAGPDTQFYMKYRIHETTCAAEENKLWQDCDYKVPAEAKTGECTAQVHMNNAEKTSNVSQDCKIFPATPKITLTEATCLGCFHPIPSDSSEVSEILKQAIQKFNRHSAEPAFFKLVEIKEAKRQRVGKCDAKAYQNLHAEIIDIASQCKLPAEDTVIPATRSGCPKTIPKDSPELKELLKVSMEKYNSESNDDFYYKGGEIEAATVQVVAGQNYHLVFAIRKTNCSKTEFEKFNEDCEATSDSAPLPCEAQIHVIPWENKIFPQVNCSKERSMTVLLRRPPGFTPFRSFATLDQPNEISCSDKNEEERQRPGKEMRKDGGQEPEGEGEHEHKHRHEHEHKHEHKHRHKHGHKHRHGYKKDHESDKRHRHEIGCGHRTGHGCGHKKHSKNGKHKHPTPKSSQESNERVFNQNETLPSYSAETASELVNPGVARKETSTPAEPLTLPDASLFNGLPDRPEPLLPRCPGKPWKQIMDLPAPSGFPREFTNEDLLPSAVENIDPATESSTPPQNKDFDISDALL
ncbi:kininogen-1 isoform X3 [Aquila chrysaetos chrysaetos]|uniref:kininogen-1 isoform X3 n=1 Tax=Aquila chrysaetos chrysaetos TaxID=223781 RepID=UPI0005D08D95|nr:kininogen-1 isoform X3 [Aquila chrysaetos chrysaetos]